MKERFPHYLRENRSQKVPHDFIFVDTETKQEQVSRNEVKHSLRLGWCVYYHTPEKKQPEREEWYEFRKVEDFWDFVEKHSKERSRIILISHNISFDFSILDGFEQLKNRGYDLLGFYMKMGASILRFRKGEKRARKTITVIDNLNFFTGKLAEIGKVVNLPKLKVNFNTVGDDELSIYCKRDVEILLVLWKRYLQFLAENDLGVFGVTSASQSFNAYRHRFLHTKILLHTHKQALDLEQYGYHGGRTEAFFIGDVPEKKIYDLDVNSMYPFVMKKFKYPKYLVGYEEDVPLKELFNKLQNFYVIADVNLETKVPAFPFFDGVTLFYPIGKFRTILNWSELLYALQYEKIEKVNRLAFYDEADLFSEYVDYFYALKKKYKAEKNRVYYLFVKRFMNSLYGKFGQKTDEWEIVGRNDPRPTGIYEVWNVRTQKGYTERVIYGLCQRNVDRKTAFNAFPAIAAGVTANARMYLWSLILKAGRKNVYYCDTDSLFVNEQGLHNLSAFLSDSELGKLKVEGISNKCTIYGAKDYEFGDTVRMKGIRPDAEYLGNDSFLQEEFPSIVGMIRDRKLDGYIVKKVRKHLYRTYLKGNILADGWVDPIKLPL